MQADSHQNLAASRGVSAVPLGITTRTTSPQYPRASQGIDLPAFDLDTGEILTPSPQVSRATRWALKSAVNKILPGSRTSKCMVFCAPVTGQGLATIQLCKGNHGKAYYQGLMACGSVWTCPVCAAKIAERRHQY